MGSGLLPFVHPGLAGAALLAGAMPVLIHLINRRRYRRVPWAAMRFLEAAARRSTRHLRIEQLLLLATRVALVVLLGVALARPFVPTAGWLPLESGGVHRVILLDNSLSMSARRPDGRSRFDVAREVAANLINGFPQSDPISLVTLAAPAARRIGQPSYDRRLAREQIAAIVPTQRSTDFSGGLAAALELVNNSPTAEGNQAVYVISDFPATVWTRDSVGFEEAGTASPSTITESAEALRQIAVALPDPFNQLILVPVDQTGSNAAIVDLTTDARLISRELPVRFSASVANFADVPLRSAEITLVHNGRPVRREPVPTVDAGGVALVTASLILAEPGTHTVEARLNVDRGDVLAEDNSRYLTIDVREDRRVLLVEGRPGIGRLDGEAGFLAAALSPESIAAPGYSRPGTALASLITPKTVLSAEISGEPLHAYDVIAVCNVPRLSQEDWTRLGEFVGAGGGLFVFLGDEVNLDHYNRFGHSDGKGILPAKLDRTVDVATLPGYAHGAQPFGFRFDEAGALHPVVADFRGRPTSGLYLARVHQYIRVVADPAQTNAVLRYSNGEPAMVAAERGSGRVLLYTTTANMEWNNLPARGDYVSLMLSAVAHLSAGREQGGRFLVGQPVNASLDASQVAMETQATSPGGESLASSIVPQGDGLALQTDPVERSGFVAVNFGGQARQFAVNVNADESNLARVDPARLSSALNVPFRWVEREQLAGMHASVKQSAELGGYALYAATLLLLCELWLAMHFASRQGGRA